MSYSIIKRSRVTLAIIEAAAIEILRLSPFLMPHCRIGIFFRVTASSRRYCGIISRAARACGACHKAELINEDDASGLISFYQHTKMGGYLIEDGDVVEVIEEIMGYFE